MSQAIRGNLTLATANLSATVRSRTSARDRRPSAEAFGGLGVAMLLVPALIVLVPDLVTVGWALARAARACQRSGAAARGRSVQGPPRGAGAGPGRTDDVMEVDDVSEIVDAD